MDTSRLDAAGVPEYYTDSVRIGATPYSLVLQFGLLTESPGEQQPVANVRMSPQHAWVLARLLRRHIDEYERAVGPINLPASLIDDLGLRDD